MFFGYAAGVGKTYAMLSEAHVQLEKGADVLAGYIEPHTRPDTMNLVVGLAVLAPKSIDYKGITLAEFDIDRALEIRPQLILVDELAHTNAVGSRNKKRYQDIEELLGAGIDVYTSVNVQHIESLNNLVEDITKIKVSETIPDYIFDNADMIKLIDIEPDELLRRIEEGKIYKEERAKTALNNFFVDDNLRLLREIAMRKVADKISSQSISKENLVNSKFLLCMSTSPLSQRAIRWTARAAEAFHATWIAVYVENVDNNDLTDEQQKNLNINMELVKKLGGEVATLSGFDIAETVAAYAKIANITNIVIGKSLNKKTIVNFYKLQLEDKLALLIPNIEVHIISGGHVRTFFAPKRKSVKIAPFSCFELLKAILVLVVSTLICFGLQALEVSVSNIIIIYILSAFVTALLTKKYIYGLITSLLNVLTFNFFFTAPFFTFHTLDSSYGITFVIMFIVSMIASGLITTIQKQRQYSLFREKKTSVLFEINKNLLVAGDERRIVELGLSYLQKLFSVAAVFYASPSDSGTIANTSGDNGSYLLTQDSQTVVKWVFVNGKVAGRGTDTLSGTKAIFIPAISQSKIHGVFGLSCVELHPTYDHIVFIKTIATLTAVALESEKLSRQQNLAIMDTEKEKVRAGLLMAISHDLRTPLTGIYGASSAIIENEMSIDTRNELLGNIKEESQWLIRMIENLLSVTKISEKNNSIKKSDEVVEEIVAEAISRVKKRYGNREIRVKVPDELLIVPMDSMLIVQVLINLIENAVKYSPRDCEIFVNVYSQNERAVFEIIDNGYGIDKNELPHLFEYASKKSSTADSQRGLGIGLLICNTIVTAHNGKIEAISREEGGTIMRFSLPRNNLND